MRRRELSRRLVTIVQFFLSMSRQYDDQTECGVMPTFSYSLQKFNVAAVIDDDYEDDDDDDDDDNNNNNGFSGFRPACQFVMEAWGLEV